MHSNGTQMLEPVKLDFQTFVKANVKKTEHKKHNIVTIPVILIAVMAVLNIVSWLSTDFSDWYAENIFPLWNNTVSRLTGMFSFSVGEILIAIGIIILLAGPAAFIICIVVLKKQRKKVCRLTAIFLLLVFTYITVTETLNCFIMYHCTPFSEKYMAVSDEHDYEQLVGLCNILIEKANYYSEKVERDEKGKAIVPDNLNELTKQAMINISNDYPMLSGYYPDAKKIMSSKFMTQLSLKGVYFPFTLEANYNKDMYSLNFPDTICHEMSHLKGFIQEDEANFISFIACTNSDSAYFQYSGYVSALGYTLTQLVGSMKSDNYKIDMPLIHINDYIYKDSIFVEDDYLEKLEEEAVIPTEAVSVVSEMAVDTSLKLNGVEDGSQSYGRMVDLLLSYYYQESNI